MTTVEVHDGFRFLVRDPGETGHTMPIEHPRATDLLATVAGWLLMLVAPFRWVGRYLGAHRRGAAAVVVGLAVTAEHMVAFLMLGQAFLAVASGVIGLLAIAVGITYYAMGA